MSLPIGPSMDPQGHLVDPPWTSGGYPRTPYGLSHKFSFSFF